MNPELCVNGFFFNNFEKNTNIAKEMVDAVKGRYKVQFYIYETKIRKAVIAQELVKEHKPLAELKREAGITLDYYDLAEEFLQIVDEAEPPLF